MRASGSSVLSQAFLRVPVKLHTVSTSTRGVKFSLLSPITKNKVRQVYYDGESGEFFSRSELVRGYEVSKGKFITFETDELKKINEHLNGEISIVEYVSLDQIEQLYLGKAYYLSVDRSNAKAYSLINKAMSDLQVCAICKFNARGKQHLACIMVHDDILILRIIEYADNVKQPDHVPRHEAEYSDEELHLTKQLIQMSRSENFKHNNYADISKDTVMQLINSKIEDSFIPDVEHSTTNPHDMISALLASLKEQTKNA